MCKISRFFDENPWRNKSSKLNIFGSLFPKTHSALGGLFSSSLVGCGCTLFDSSDGEVLSDPGGLQEAIFELSEKLEGHLCHKSWSFTDAKDAHFGNFTPVVFDHVNTKYVRFYVLLLSKATSLRLSRSPNECVEKY